MRANSINQPMPAPEGGRVTRVFFFTLLAALFLAAPQLRAADPATGFEAANKLYEQGKYSEAAAAYDQLLAAGAVSEALYFNRGNALFKLGQTGRAIASYRHAQQLAPRDADVRANLQIARTRARGGSAFPQNRFLSWLEFLSLNEWTLLTGQVLWLFFILLALGQWRPALQLRLRNYLLVAGGVVLLLGVCLAIRVDRDLLTASAIVIAGEADVRNGPLDESQGIFKVRDGAELVVIDRKEDWLQVVDTNQRTGWLRREQVILFDSPPAEGKRISRMQIRALIPITCRNAYLLPRPLRHEGGEGALISPWFMGRPG